MRPNRLRREVCCSARTTTLVLRVQAAARVEACGDVTQRARRQRLDHGIYEANCGPTAPLRGQPSRPTLAEIMLESGAVAAEVVV